MSTVEQENVCEESNIVCEDSNKVVESEIKEGIAEDEVKAEMKDAAAEEGFKEEVKDFMTEDKEIVIADKEIKFGESYPKITLVSTSIGADVEPIRWCLYYAGIPFEDRRIPTKHLEEELSRAPGGKLPYMIVDDEREYIQKLGMLLFVGKLAKLVPCDDLELLNVMMHTCSFEEAVEKFVFMLMLSKEELEETREKKIKECATRLKSAESMLLSHYKFDNDQLSIADFVIAARIHNLVRFDESALSNDESRMPTAIKIYHRVMEKATPSLLAYVEKQDSLVAKRYMKAKAAETETAKEVEETVKEVEEAAKEVEETAKEVEETAKEVEETATEVEETTKEVEEKAEEVEETAKEVEEKAEEVEETATGVEETAKEIVETAKEVEETAKEVEETADEIKEAAEEVKETTDVKEVEETAEEVEETAKEVEETAKEIKETAEEMKETAEEVKETTDVQEVEETAKEVEETAKEVEETAEEVEETTKELGETIKEVVESNEKKNESCECAEKSTEESAAKVELEKEVVGEVCEDECPTEVPISPNVSI